MTRHLLDLIYQEWNGHSACYRNIDTGWKPMLLFSPYEPYTLPHRRRRARH